MLKRFAFFTTLLFVSLLLLSITRPALSQATAGFNLQALDDYLRQQVSANQIPGLAVAVVQGDQIVFSKGYGVAAQGQAITGQTQFYIGSLTKTFTALAVMQLVEQGQLELDAPVQRYLPAFTLADPAAAQQVTIRQLLNQTSGLGEGSDPGVSDFSYADTLDEQVRGMADARLLSAPGSKYQYYNGNYQVLGRVIEQVSGQSYADYMREHVFATLGMRRTVTEPQSAPLLAQGHGMTFGWPVARSQAYRAGGLPSGYLISSAEDLAHLMIAELNQGRYNGQQMLSPASLTITQTPPEGIDSTYGMGWVAFNDAQYGRVLYHDGALENYNAQIILLPDRGAGLVALTNQGGLVRQLSFNPLVTSGMADFLGGVQPKPVSYAWIGWVLLGLVLLDAAGHAWQFWRLPAWARKMANRSRRAQWLHTLPGLLIPLVLLVVILLVLGNQPGGFAALSLLPDVAAWALVGLSLAAVRGGLKVYRVWRNLL